MLGRQQDVLVPTSVLVVATAAMVLGGEQIVVGRVRSVLLHLLKLEAFLVARAGPC